MSAIFNVGNRIMNTYVYNTPAGYIMVDTGYEHSLTSVEKKMKKQGINLSDIKYVFLTHAHDDHAGFLDELLHRNSELKVIMSNRAMPTLKRVTIWIENKEQFEQSWEVLLKEDVDWIYPAHGEPFQKSDLRRCKGVIKHIRLRLLKM